MPIFEYRCGSCGQRFEKLVKSAAHVICPECGSMQVEKLLSSFAVTKSSTSAPRCAASCGEGFADGVCGSGKCRGGD